MAVKKVRPESIDCRIRRPDGTQRILHVQIEVICAADGKPVRLYGTVQDTTDQIRIEEELRQSREKLRSLAVELQIAEERQRRQLAGDLHDSVGQLLAFSARELQALQAKASRKISGSLQEITQQLHKAIKQTRTLSFDLSPSILYDLGFDVAVEDLADQFMKKHNIRCRFRNCPLPKPLSDPVKVLLYRSVRELLFNIAKHAEAKTAGVTLKRIGDELQIRVEDDGRGCAISEDGKSGGFGLFSIRERLRHIGGHFALESVTGKGTVVTLVAPLSIEKEREKQ